MWEGEGGSSGLAAHQNLRIYGPSMIYHLNLMVNQNNPIHKNLGVALWWPSSDYCGTVNLLSTNTEDMVQEGPSKKVYPKGLLESGI